MLTSPSTLPEQARASISKNLNELLACSLDLYSMAKVAHWNVRGPNFKALHILFDEVAGVALSQADDLAERLVALGGTAAGTVREAAETTSLKSYPAGIHDGPEHTSELLARLEFHVALMKAARKAVEKEGDVETSNMLQGFVADLEKYGWQLAASLG